MSAALGALGARARAWKVLSERARARLRHRQSLRALPRGRRALLPLHICIHTRFSPCVSRSVFVGVLYRFDIGDWLALFCRIQEDLVGKKNFFLPGGSSAVGAPVVPI